MIKKRGFLTQLARHLVQLAAFVLFPGLFISVFSAVRDLVTAFVGGRFSFGGLFPQILLVFAVFLVTALWGRFFCGFLCSFGMLVSGNLSVVSRAISYRGVCAACCYSCRFPVCGALFLQVSVPVGRCLRFVPEKGCIR